MDFSRRRFTVLGGGTLAGLAIGTGLPFGAGSAQADEAPAATPAAAGPVPDGAARTVSFDQYSLLVDGERVPLWSGEIHPFRLPSPELWPDLLQKLRASGFNSISVYVAWNYHSPAPGVYDFTGVRDLGAFLDHAARAGLYVIVRPGPYINAEVDAGGYPGWLLATAGTARTDNATYLAHVDEYLSAVDAVIAPRQYSTGGGTVLLYQLENEYASYLSGSTGKNYLAHLYAKVRADGITVPLFHNDKGRNGYWTPDSFPTSGPDGTETGRYLYAFDGYPSPSSTPPDWGYFGTGGSKGGSTASPDTPGFMAEFGGGWFDCWGGAEFDGQGYAGARATRDAGYERRFYLTNLANGIKIHNVYMAFGGTSWGWLPAPVVYTSYDYGAAIDEARNPTAKTTPMKQIGSLLTAVPDLAKLDRAADTTAADTALKVYHLTNPDTAAHIYVVRNDHTADISTTLDLAVAEGTLTVPLQVSAKDARLFGTGIALGSRQLHHTTAQPMLQGRIGRQDVALLVGRPGAPVQLALACPEQPAVSLIDGAADWSYDPATALLTVTATLSGLTRLSVSGDGNPVPLLLLLADDDACATLWPTRTATGTVLVRGPALLRTAHAEGQVLQLTGDTTASSDLEVWAPRGIERVTWNGETVHTRTTRSGSLAAQRSLAGPPAITLPALTGWRSAAGNPESAPGYDDSAWTVADRTTGFSSTPVPAGGPVLFSDDYGFHYGDLWYRASWTGARDASALQLSYQTGTQGLLMAWLDGVPLGTHRMPVPTLAQATTATWTATATLPLPADQQGDGSHVLSVLMRPMAHSEDGGANDAQKAGRGLTAAAFTLNSGSAPTPVWRIQGADTAAVTAADPLRGPLNNGGLHGERSGWHLPRFDDRHWSPAVFPAAAAGQGVTWYRTGFRLRVPEGLDASIGLTLTDDPTRAYRVQLFLNGWNLGQYINDVGPQHTFVLPNGILDPNGSNTLALAVLADGTTPAGPGSVALTLLGSVEGGPGAATGTWGD